MTGLIHSSQLVFKKEAADLDRRAAIYEWSDEKRANQAALAISVRVDAADRFTAGGPVKAHPNEVVIYSLIAKNIVAWFQEHVADL